MRQGLAICLGLPAIVTTLGCGMGMFNANGAIVEDQLGSFRTLAVTAERRVIMFNEQSQRYCAEPSPDVAQNISAALRTAVDASGKGYELGAEFSRALAVTVQRLMNRSQGLQLYRDGMYYLCQGFMNKVVTEAEFKAKSQSLLETAQDLIKSEIVASGGNINATPASPVPTLPELQPSPRVPRPAL